MVVLDSETPPFARKKVTLTPKTKVIRDGSGENRKADSLTKGKSVRNEAMWACRSAAKDLPDSSAYLALFMCLRGQDGRNEQDEKGTASVVYPLHPSKGAR